MTEEEWRVAAAETRRFYRTVLVGAAIAVALVAFALAAIAGAVVRWLI